MKTDTAPAIPGHLTRHFAAQDAGQFTPWFKSPKDPAKAEPDTVKIYSISLMIDGHVLESCEVTATTATAALERAVDLRLAQAIRERRPNLSIKPWAITGTRLAA
jgi:hypothetical protein